MQFFRYVLFAIVVTIGSMVMSNGYAQSPKAPDGDLENMLYMDLDSGRVVIQLRPDLAPGHVKRIKELTREGFYNGIVFHRVIEGFMAQAGDPTGTGRGGSTKPDLKAEFSNESHLRGVVSMARRSDSEDSANSQFFIVLQNSDFLDRQYTIWGKVIEGMQFVDLIKKGDSNDNGVVEEPDHIISMQVAADVEGKSIRSEH